jgi:mitochondrial fission protein ELM1
MLADQNAGKRGIFIRFFNRECSWHTGPFEISNRTGCSIVPIFIVRKYGPYHKLFILPELEGTEEEKLKKFVPVFEDFIRQNPQQWLWMHRRWKTKNDLKITLLTDGKAGHRNQCLKIIEHIKNSYSQQVIINEISVQYKNRFYKTFVTLNSLFYKQGQIGTLKYFLDKNSFEKISFETSDVVVSAGSSTAGINLILSKENLSKSIVLMKPSFLPLKNFTLCIIPQHDRVAKRENVIFTRTAVGSIDRTSIEQASLELKSELNIDRPCIGVFIGGDTRYSRLCPETIEKISKEILRIAEEKNFYLLITTSRRTSSRVENVLSGMFKNNKRCRLLVIANRKNRKNVVAAILGLSGVVVVSAESMSMIAEACSFGRYVITFLPQRIRFFKTKYEKAVQRLQTQRFLKIADQETIYNTIKQAIDMNLKHRTIQDDLRIKERLKNILARI